MEESNGSKGNGGIGFCGLLAIAFIVLKLCGVIHWSWFLVLAPIWLPAILVTVIAVVIVLISRL